MSLIIEDHLFLLIGILVVVMALFFIGYVTLITHLWLPAMFSMIVISGLIVILAKHGGDKGETV